MKEVNTYTGRFRVAQNGKVFFPSDKDPTKYETVTWHTGWKDRNGVLVFGGDIIKRVRHLAAEHEREWLQKNQNAPDVNDIESFVDDYSGALGVIEWEPAGYHIRNLKGHKRAFTGPEGGLEVNLEEEIEIVGNIWENQELL